MAVGSAVGVTHQPHTLRSLAVLQPAERRLLRALAAGEYSRSDMGAVAAGHASLREAPLRVDARKLAGFVCSVNLAGGHGSDHVMLPPQHTSQLMQWLSASGSIVADVDGAIEPAAHRAQRAACLRAR